MNGWVERYDPGRLLSICVIKEHDLDSRGVSRENAEINAGVS
jgi:hypothetical protein